MRPLSQLGVYQTSWNILLYAVELMLVVHAVLEISGCPVFQDN